MPFTIAAANKLIDKLLRNVDFTQLTTPYVSLHTGDPGESGANEVTGGSYIRKAATFAAAASKASTTSGDLEWTNMPAVTVTHVGIWDAESGGNFWWGGALTASKEVPVGANFTVAAGDLDIALT